MTHWHILGPGAVGCLMAALLDKNGIKVTLIGRENSTGFQTLHYQSPAPNSTTSTIQVEYTTTAQLNTPMDVLLICTKSHSTKQPVEALSSHITAHTTLVLLQNGLGNHEWLAQRFPENPIVLGSISHGVMKIARDKIQHTGLGTCQLGSYGQLKVSQESIAPLPDDDEDWGMSWQDNILQALWYKLGVNAAINPLTVIYDCKNGELLDGAEREARMEQLAWEVESLMGYFDITPPTDGLIGLVKQVAKRTASNSSSMREDSRAGRITEIEDINGYVMRKAQEAGLNCPANAEVLETLQHWQDEKRDD
ncbi:ketopantoate reductase family protein [Pokkaliibacter sp. CJK22405]|uniref:ketopantoate reductase family protein n=1 Tax=Pokkaliibacter sp. CJK22405 TaxID=3384615 RepID=UPI0039853D89